MPWFKVDDKFHAHRKTRKAGLSAIGLWVIAGTWASDNLTDGFVPADVIRGWGAKPTDAARLVTAGLWSDATVDGEVGYRFHDWQKFQPSAAVTAAMRAKESEAGQRGNHVRWHLNKGISDPDCEYCYRVPDYPPDRVPDTQPESGGESGANRPVPVPDNYAISNEIASLGAAQSAATPKRQRGSRIPDDWSPSNDLAAAMADEGIPLAAQAVELLKFRDYWTAKTGRDATKLDWDATFRNWLRRARDNQPRRPATKRQEDDAMFERQMARALANQQPPLGELA